MHWLLTISLIKWKGTASISVIMYQKDKFRNLKKRLLGLIKFLQVNKRTSHRFNADESGQAII